MAGPGCGWRHTALSTQPMKVTRPLPATACIPPPATTSCSPSELYYNAPEIAKTIQHSATLLLVSADCSRVCDVRGGVRWRDGWIQRHLTINWTAALLQSSQYPAWLPPSSTRPGPSQPASTTTTFSKLTWIMVIMVKFEAVTL